MSNKKKELRNLAESTLVEVSIECDKCKKANGTQFTDEDYFAEELYSKGWRCPVSKVYCPDCAKKYLKLIKKKK